MKLYIAVLDEVPDFIVPTLVAHTTINAHTEFSGIELYDKWLKESFKKCVVKVNRKEFGKIKNLPNVYLGHENKTLNGEKSCAIVLPYENKDLPNVLKFAKLWKPNISVWKKHVPQCSVHDIVLDGVSRSFTDEQIIDETNGIATSPMIKVYREWFNNLIEAHELD